MSFKIYLSPERRPAPHGPYFGYPSLFEHDVATAIAEKGSTALQRCGFLVKMAPPAATLRVRVAEAIQWQANYYLPIHTNASSSTGKEEPPAARRCWPTANRAAPAGGPAK